MKTPFKFGRIVIDEAFVNRKDELKKLSANMLNGINTIIISPRRWGKSSLVKKASLLLLEENQDIRFCFVDLFQVRTEEDFYRLFAKEVIKTSSNKLEEWMDDVRIFFARFSPKITVGVDMMNDFELGLDVKELKKDPDDILQLPEIISVKKGFKLIVCIDEFQNIGNFTDSLAFQKKLRSVWQIQQNVTYCLYGSKRHMMLEIFEKKSHPFYRFGSLMNMHKIAREHFIEYIIHSFDRTGKSISTEFAQFITDTVRNHPYYVQQLAHLVWENTVRIVNQEVMNMAVDDLLTTNTLFYESEAEALSNTQINLLRAVASGVRQFTSIQNLSDYRLGSSATVIKNKKILEKRELLNKDLSGFEFEDPVFEIWFKKRFRI